MDKLSFLIIGPQGSGKGTQAKILAKRLNLAYFSMGEELKRVRDSDTALGKKGRPFYDRGVLWPEYLVKQVLIQSLKQLNLKQGIIFEGYPRTLYQEKIFRKISKKFHLPDPWVIYLKLSQKSIIDRIGKRRICPSCGRAFHPQDRDYQKSKCLKCQAPLMIRPDDQPEAIKKRLAVYHKRTKPLIDYYRKKDRLIEINGEPAIEEVSKEIWEKIKEMMR